MKAFELFEYTSSKPLIAIDIQPAYSHVIPWISDFTKFMNNHKGKILCLVNAEYTDTTDDYINDIIEYYVDNGLREDSLNKMKFYDKGYGYLREWMDVDIDNRDIIKTVRTMYQERVESSEDLSGDFVENIDGMEDWTGPLRINWVPITMLRLYTPGYLCGGGRYECLAEVQLLMSAFNMKYKIIDRFVYG